MKNGWRVPSFLPSCSYSFFLPWPCSTWCLRQWTGDVLTSMRWDNDQENGSNKHDIAWWIIPWQMCIRNHRPQWLWRTWEGHRTSQDKTCLAGKKTIEDTGGSAPTCSCQKKPTLHRISLSDSTKVCRNWTPRWRHQDFVESETVVHSGNDQHSYWTWPLK